MTENDPQDGAHTDPKAIKNRHQNRHRFYMKKKVSRRQVGLAVWVGDAPQRGSPGLLN